MPVLSFEIHGHAKFHHAFLTEQLRDLKAAAAILETLLQDVDGLVLKPNLNQ